MDFDPFVVCAAGTARILYQGKLTASKYLRVPIPLPSDGLQGTVKITATFCFATLVDPEHPGNYTRSGLEITFRPHSGNFATEESTHAKSDSFFKPSELYPAENVLRRDAHKWETCLHSSKSKRATSLKEPVFDIHYNARLEGHRDPMIKHIPYALVITVETPRILDLYDRIIRQYGGRLRPLLPVIQIPVQT